MAAAEPRNTVTLTNPATGQSVEVPIDAAHGFVPATAVKQLVVDAENPVPGDKVPLMLYDPGFAATVACRSKVSRVDGATGHLYYRGYSIEELFEHSSFTETTYLLIHGELPTRPQLDAWQRQLLRHTYLHSELERQLESFRWDSHPMGMLIASLSSLSSFHPEANPALVGDALYVAGPREQYLPLYSLSGTGAAVRSEGNAVPSTLEVRDHMRNKAVLRIMGKLPTLAANVFRHREGRPYNRPMPNPRSITENFMYMLDKLNEDDYVPDRALVNIMDKAFILLAEHGSSCSTITMRHLVSSGVDPFTATAGACGTLFGERKCGSVIRMLETISNTAGIQGYLDAVKAKACMAPAPTPYAVAAAAIAAPAADVPASNSPLKLMGFGHRIYRAPDPRVRLMRGLVMETFRHIYQQDPSAPSAHLVYLALKLEEAVEADEYFSKRKLFPNIDYWTAVLFHTLGFPRDMFPVLLSIPRSAGYLAHFIECCDAKEPIYRPRQVYLGEPLRPYVPVNERTPDSSAVATAAVATATTTTVSEVVNTVKDKSDAASIRSAKPPHPAPANLDNALSSRSNPAAQLRRSLHEAAISGGASASEVAMLIDQTRRQITSLADEITRALDAAAAAGKGVEDTARTSDAASTSSGAATASPPGTPRQILRRMLSKVQQRVIGNTNGSAVTSARASPSASTTTVDAAEAQVAQFASMAETLVARQNELRELLDVQRELLKMQSSLRQGQHDTDAVDLASFERMKI